MRDSPFHIGFQKRLGHVPTTGQLQAIDLLESFVFSGLPDDLFLLTGFAGTGKTTLIASLVQVLKSFRRKTALVAPTGRAAKVLAAYSGHPALTIHKKIYRQKKVVDGWGEFSLDRNVHRDTIFIVDESSMISNQSMELSVFGSGRLLDDLISYVYSGQGCKLILSGDTAQLPPVGLDISEALDAKVLGGYGLAVVMIQLEQVLRQQKESGILENATGLRQAISLNTFRTYPRFDDSYEDFHRMGGTELIEQIQSSYDLVGMDETIIVCRSNKLANRYNQGIRNQILWREEELVTGEQLMVVKNNYHWLREETEVDFIANGDIAEIARIHRFKELYGLRFAQVTLRLKDYRNLDFDAWILLDTLHVESAALDRASMKEFFFMVMEDYQHIKGKKHRMEAIREDPFFNALQVKYAYALTCHKSQGGQWRHVYIDQGYVTEDKMDREYYRWLYTALTRATSQVYLVNFKDDYFE